MASNTNLTELRARFRELFPEFDSTSDAVIDRYLLLAEVIFSACENAWLYLTAHLLTIDQENGVGTTGGSIDGGQGEHTSETVGKESVALKTMADRAQDTFYTTTPYGRAFIIYRNACPAYRFSVRTARCRGVYN